MRKRLLIAATLALTAIALPAWGGDWAFPAAAQHGWSANTTVALKMGAMVPDSSVGSGLAGGFELAVDDPLFQLPYGKIRDQFSYNRFDHGGLELQTLEFNPHYMIPIVENLWVGGGPGVGWVFTHSESGPSPDMVTVQLGASAYYTAGQLMVGLESRYQWAGDERVGGASSADNWLTMLKIGYAY
ncbi:hypothetical protein [Paramagnetospirillum magneticum]|nr:hypothetical protein [Paramagnetospirillum magneticum]